MPDIPAAPVFQSPNTEAPLIRRAVLLSWFTIGYNLIEGLVSIAFGLSDDSIALMGFGADSFIEVFSALFVLWRFQGQFLGRQMMPLERERTATFGIGILFLLLALVTVIGSGIELQGRSHPETTLPGLIISTLSLSFMFFLWSEKKKVGTRLGSPTILKDASCSLACIKLSVVLFSGSLLFLVFPSLWWVDSVAALGLAALIGHEGFQTIRASRSPEFEGGCCGCG